MRLDNPGKYQRIDLGGAGPQQDSCACIEGCAGGQDIVDEQQAAARELFEETGVVVDAEEIVHFRTHSSRLGDGVLLIFGVARERSWSSLKFQPKDADASEMLVIPSKQTLAFPLHTQAVAEYFDTLGRNSP